MNIIQMISPTQPPAHIKALGELAVNRERILQTLLVVILLASVIGYFGLVVYSLPRLQVGQFILYSGLLLLIFSFTAYRHLAYTTRSLLILLSILGTAIYTFATTGLEGSGELYLLAFITLTTVLLGWKAGVISLLCAHLVFFGLGFMIVQNGFGLPAGVDALAKNRISEWVQTGLFLSVVSCTITFSMGMLIRGLEAAFYRAESMSHTLASEQVSLRNRVEQRTVEIQMRMQQILTASEVSQIIVLQRDPDQLLPKIVNLVQERFNLYYVGVFIVDDANHAVLRAGSGEAGKNMMAAGHYLPVDGKSMIGWSIANNQTRIAQDVGTETVRFNNPYLPETRSEIAVPIIRQSESLGAISIQSSEANAFDEDDIAIFEGIANALAIALENTHLFTQAQEAIDEVQALNRGYLMHAWSEQENESGSLSYSYDNNQAHSSIGGNLVKVPLSLRDQVIGSITLEMEDASLTIEQQDFINAITAQTALALENARLFQQTVRRADRERKVIEISSKIRSTNDPELMMKIAVEELQHALHASKTQVILNKKINQPETENEILTGTDRHFGSNGSGKLRPV